MAPFIKGQSGYFFSVNRSKRSIGMNLKNESAKRIIREQVAPDVVLENFAPVLPSGWASITIRWQLSIPASSTALYRALAKLDPCAISEHTTPVSRLCPVS